VSSLQRIVRQGHGPLDRRSILEVPRTFRKEPGMPTPAADYLVNVTAECAQDFVANYLGLPGWLTLWRGWQKLESMVAAARIERRRRRRIRVES
jgi:hypothetical protein